MATDLIERMNFYAGMVKSGSFTQSALAVAFMLLYRHLNGNTGRCDPSISKLADETGLTKRSMNNAVDELRESGWWLVTREGAAVRGGRTNSYAPLLDAAERASGEAQFVSSGSEVVKRRTPVRAETGEKVRKKVVKRASPKPVKNQNHHRRAPIDALRSNARFARVRARVRGEDGASSEFEIFWRIYPHRGAFSDPKRPARAKFDAAVRRGVDPADIIAGAERYRVHVESCRTEARFRPHAQTWLNQERWSDQLQAPEPARLKVGMN